jgi:hypothetical protein
MYNQHLYIHTYHAAQGLGPTAFYPIYRARAPVFAGGRRRRDLGLCVQTRVGNLSLQIRYYMLGVGWVNWRSELRRETPVLDAQQMCNAAFLTCARVFVEGNV